MASGVNVKMGVSGVSQFKQDINAVKRSLKTMDAQLSLTEKEFKATGDAEKYLQDKAVELNAKLEMQESILSKAESALESMNQNGVDKSSKAFQDMQREVLNAKSAMLDTKTEIEQLGTNAGTAADNTDEMNTQLKNIGEGVAFQNITEGLKDVISQLENGARAALNFGKKIAKSAMDSTGWADDILHDAQKYGVDAETIQKMQNVAEYIETDVDTIMNARARLAKNKDKLGDLLGIDANGMSVEDAFWKAGEAIMAMTDEFEKEEAAQSVFGRNWKELIPLFTAGQDEYNAKLEEQNVLTNEQVDRLGKADDAFKQVEQEVARLKNEFWAENAGTITELLQWVVDNKDSVVTALGAIAVAIGGLKLGEAATDIMKLVNGFKMLKGSGNVPNVGTNTGGTTPGGTTAGAGKLASLGASGMLGVAGLVAIPSAFLWAQDRRLNHAEEVRGTEENLEARTAGVEELLASYITANKALDDAVIASLESNVEMTDAEFDALQKKVDETNQKLREAEGGEEALKAYSDWRQERSLGNEDWVMPDWLSESADKMEQAAADLTGGTDAQKQSSSEMIQAAGTLEGMPGQVEAAIIRGMSGIKIYIDGATAGRVVSPYVGAQMGGLVAALTK